MGFRPGLCVASVALVAMATSARAATLRVTYGAQRALPAIPSPTIGAQGVAVDSHANVYTIDGDRILELPPGASTLGTQSVVPITGLDSPSGIAVDSAGNLYVADHGGSRVVEFVAGTGAVRILAFTGLTQPTGVAVDSAGNVYVSNGSLSEPAFELPAGARQQKALPFSVSTTPQGITADSKGNVFLAAGDVLELPPAATSTNQQTVALSSGPFNDARATAVAVGPDGSLYAAFVGLGAFGVSEVDELPAGSTQPVGWQFAGLSSPTGVAADAGGVYVSDQVGSVYHLPAPMDTNHQARLPFSGAVAEPTAIVVDRRRDVFELVSGHVFELPARAQSLAEATMLPSSLEVLGLTVAPGGSVYGTAIDPSRGLPVTAELATGRARCTPTLTTGPFMIPFIGPLGLDHRCDLFWSQGSPAKVYEQRVNATSPSSLPFKGLRVVTSLAVSRSGDVYADSSGTIRVVRARAKHAARVRFPKRVSALALDPWGGVYGLALSRSGAAGSVLALRDPACRAGAAKLPFRHLSSPKAIAVDPEGDVFVTVAGTNSAVWVPLKHRRRRPSTADSCTRARR